MQTMMEKHRHRDMTVKMLEAFKAARTKRITELRNAEVEKALAEVVAKVGTYPSDTTDRQGFGAFPGWTTLRSHLITP